MNIQEKQVFKTSHVLSLFLVLGFSLVLVTRVVGSPEMEKQKKAKKKAESLAYQLIEIERGPRAQSRGPASVTPQEAFGQIGRDPWGRPFNYIVSKQGVDLLLTVTSLGPDPEDKNDDISVNVLAGQ